MLIGGLSCQGRLVLHGHHLGGHWHNCPVDPPAHRCGETIHKPHITMRSFNRHAQWATLVMASRSFYSSVECGSFGW